MLGNVDYDHYGDNYDVLATFKLPQGKIILADQFFFENYFNMRNDLSISTPFVYAPEIESVYLFSIDGETSAYLIQTEVSIKRPTNVIEVHSV